MNKIKADIRVVLLSQNGAKFQSSCGGWLWWCIKHVILIAFHICSIPVSALYSWAQGEPVNWKGDCWWLTVLHVDKSGMNLPAGPLNSLPPHFQWLSLWKSSLIETFPHWQTCFFILSKVFNISSHLVTSKAHLTSGTSLGKDNHTAPEGKTPSSFLEEILP